MSSLLSTYHGLPADLVPVLGHGPTGEFPLLLLQILVGLVHHPAWVRLVASVLCNILGKGMLISNLFCSVINNYVVFYKTSFSFRQKRKKINLINSGKGSKTNEYSETMHKSRIEHARKQIYPCKPNSFTLYVNKAKQR